MPSPSFVVGVAKKKKARVIAIAFFYGGFCREKEGDGSCHRLLLWGPRVTRSQVMG
jgi:hypothetical protein